MKFLMKGYVAMWLFIALLGIFLTGLPEKHWDKVTPYLNLLQFIGIGLYLAGGFIFKWADCRKAWRDRMCLFLSLCGGAAFITASSMLYVPLLI